MQTQLRARLLADAAISGLVGTRIDWDIRPQGKTLPAITLSLVSDRREQHMGGLQTTRGTWVQFDVWATTAAQVATLRDAIVGLIATGATQDGITFFGAQNIDAGNRGLGVGETTGFEETSTTIVHRGMVQATIWHTVIP